MEKRARTAGISGRYTFVSAALLSMVSGGIAHTKDDNRSKIIVHNQSIGQNLWEHTLATNFEERWSGSEKEFVFGADGVVKPATEAQEDLHNPGGPNQIDAQIGHTRSASDDTFGPEVLQPPIGKLEQIDASRTAEGGQSEAQTCGPSPLGTDEIKSLVVRTARKYGVDERFASAITWAESGFDQSRNSPKGASGPMQLMPATAARFGVEDICDPAQNIEGGVKYLRALLDEFQNPLLVAAAYNSGEQRIYQHGGIPPFKETVGYVAKVVNYQLGLPMPSATGKARIAASQAVSDADSSGDAGVIAVKKTGTFVGGVMHF
ncbi:lytic transglycosylase domain-containing protein (plasmid) [Ensifer adhaerens]|uniref:lytic transglycosylase domain-containing protein n=1 Tax=Ensifer adhaerens TaxID=106592 RepID=UPI0021015C32|nr:lytic transglycosylase domain-containing protein [Ensifer adhaerens]UTV41822.1 lytic transglycosylase domain-containing protein [Ensifer adhaerens]